MEISPKKLKVAHAPHDWLRKLNLSFVPGPMSAMLEELADGLMERFALLGHNVEAQPTDKTDVLLTTAAFGESLSWRKAALFSARRQFGIKHSPVVYTMVQATPTEFDDLLGKLRDALSQEPIDPTHFQFEGLGEHSHRVLIEQGTRGGPILALLRVLQAQTKSIHVMLAVGKAHAERVYHFDLVGAYPSSEADNLDAFYSDIALRVVTTESTNEITDHRVVGEMINRELWEGMSSPEAMRRAGKELGARNFFTEMVRIEDLVHVPVVNDSVASQYSEGCFATWDAHAQALVATVTGSARPVDKGNIGDDDLAVIVGVREDGLGAEVRHVEGKSNDPPSSEAVEMMDMDEALPRVAHEMASGVKINVPVIRSKLHGHRGVKAFNPELIEYVPLEAPYYHYLVSCATAAQARGIKEAFSRAESLLNPDDPRQAAFTVLPGHGLVIVEKWQGDKAPFELLWSYMDSGDLVIDPHVPQGQMSFEVEEDELMHLREDRKVF